MTFRGVVWLCRLTTVLAFAAGLAACSKPQPAPDPQQAVAPATPPTVAPPKAAASKAAASKAAAPGAEPSAYELASPQKRAACPGLEGFDTTSAPGCREIGCRDEGFRLETFPKDAWPHGAYRFVFDIDGRSVTCSGALPLKPCGEASIHCDGGAARVGTSGCALAPAAHAFGGMYFPGYPKAVTLTLFVDERQVARASYTPSYSANQPNGRGCHPVCCGASAAFTLPKSLTGG